MTSVTTMPSRCRTTFGRRCARGLHPRILLWQVARGPLASQVPHAASTRLTVRPIAPFRLDLTVWTLRRRRRNAIDRWDGETYRRIVLVAERRTELAIRQTGSSAAPRLIVTATPSLRTTSDRRHVRLIVDQLLGPRI